MDLDRRRPGQSEIVSPRDEEDKCQILSGVFEGLTLGTPISVMVWNKDARPEAYREMEISVPALSRRLHLPGKIWDSELAGRRARFRARNNRSSGGRGHRQESTDQIFS